MFVTLRLFPSSSNKTSSFLPISKKEIASVSSYFALIIPCPDVALSPRLTVTTSLEATIC